MKRKKYIHTNPTNYYLFQIWNNGKYYEGNDRIVKKESMTEEEAKEHTRALINDRGLTNVSRVVVIDAKRKEVFKWAKND